MHTLLPVQFCSKYTENIHDRVSGNTVLAQDFMINSTLTIVVLPIRTTKTGNTTGCQVFVSLLSFLYEQCFILLVFVLAKFSYSSFIWCHVSCLSKCEAYEEDSMPILIFLFLLLYWDKFIYLYPKPGQNHFLISCLELLTFLKHEFNQIAVIWKQ